MRSGNLWLKGHTGSCLILHIWVEPIYLFIFLPDAGAATILWSQEVAALQIRNHEDSEWRWVKHIENALVCYIVLPSNNHQAKVLGYYQVVNCGDALTMLSGGYYKSAIHRVVQPPSGESCL